MPDKRDKIKVSALSFHPLLDHTSKLTDGWKTTNPIPISLLELDRMGDHLHVEAYMDDIQLLYVEDSKASQKLLVSAMLSIADCYQAMSLGEARELLATHQFTIFVIDYYLPDGDGLELVAQLRADPHYAKTPIILYSAGLDEDLAFRAMKMGVNDSFAKPINMLDLRDHIVNLVETPTTIKNVRRKLIQMTCSLWFADGIYHAFSVDFNHHIDDVSEQVVRQKMRDYIEINLQSSDDPDQYPVDVEMFKCIVEMEGDDLRKWPFSHR